MRRLQYALLCIVLNMSVVLHLGSSTLRNRPESTPLCFSDTPRNFGTTHFIVGYDSKKVIREQTRSKDPIFRKQQSVLLDGTTLIDKNRISQSFFTTTHDLSPVLLELLSESDRRLYIAAFTLTDSRIVKHVIAAHNNGVDVCIIVDQSNMRQPYSKVQTLIDGNIPVWCYTPRLNPNYKKNGHYEPFMHHKIIIGDDFVVTGSANFTKAGQKNNIENITILRERQAVDEYHAEFERLKKFCTQCAPQAKA